MKKVFIGHVNRKAFTKCDWDKHGEYLNWPNVHKEPDPFFGLTKKIRVIFEEIK